MTGGGGCEYFPGWMQRDGIFILLRSPGIDSMETIPPAHVAWWASTTTVFLLGFWPPIDCYKIPAQCRENLESIIYAESLLLSTWRPPPPPPPPSCSNYQKSFVLKILYIAKIFPLLRKYFYTIERHDLQDLWRRWVRLRFSKKV